MGGNGRQMEQVDGFQERRSDDPSHDRMLRDSQRDVARPGDRTQKIYNDVPAMTQITARLPEQAHAVGFKDRQPEPNQTIRHVDNFDRQGNKMGGSDYIYPKAADGSVQMNGYVDRDANGAIKEFAVRLPRLKDDRDPVFQKDVFMVYRARPGVPIDENQMNETIRLLSNYDMQGQKKSPEQALADQSKFFKTEPLGDNLIRLRDMQVISVGLDPETGKRFTVRAQELAKGPDGRPQQEGPKELTWFEPGKTGQMVRLDRLSAEDNQTLLNAKMHGNLRGSIDPTKAADLPQRLERQYPVSPDQGYDDGSRRMPPSRMPRYGDPIPGTSYDPRQNQGIPQDSDGTVRRRKG
jgi:hypothetical protein